MTGTRLTSSTRLRSIYSSRLWPFSKNFITILSFHERLTQLYHEAGNFAMVWGRFEKDRGAVKKVPQHSSQCRMSLATKKHKKRLQPFCSIIKLRNKMKTRGSLWTDKERLWIPQIPDNREKECADRAAVSGSGVQSQKAMNEAVKKKA